MEEKWAVETDEEGMIFVGDKVSAGEVFEMATENIRGRVEIEGTFSDELKERVRLLRLEIHVEKELKPEVDEDGEGTGFWEEIEG